MCLTSLLPPVTVSLPVPSVITTSLKPPSAAFWLKLSTASLPAPLCLLSSV